MPVAVSSLRNAREPIYSVLTLVVGILLWPVLAIAAIGGLAYPETSALVGVYIFYGVLIWLFFLLSSFAYQAHAFGNMVLLGPSQFPDLHAMVEEASRELGFRTVPRTFLYNSNGLFNAFARRVLARRYVFLTSALVEASSDEQVRFVIGHELGHHAAGHLNGWLSFLRLPANIVPFLMPAYSRSREYTCDQIGAHLSRDPDVARSALQMLGCGCRRLNTQMSCEAFAAQERSVPPVWGFLNEIFRSHPRLTRRVAAIRDRASTARFEARPID